MSGSGWMAGCLLVSSDCCIFAGVLKPPHTHTHMQNTGRQAKTDGRTNERTNRQTNRQKKNVLNKLFNKVTQDGWMRTKRNKQNRRKTIHAQE